MEKLGNQNWAWEDVLPFFRKSENYPAQENKFHAKNGEWYIQIQKENNQILNIIRNAAAEIGIPKINDFNKGNNEGSAYFNLNKKNKNIHSTQCAFINPIKKRKNLHIECNARVNKIIIEEKYAKDVTFYKTDQKKNITVRAKKEIIITAGAIGTPKILELSGIGNPDLLLSQNITVIHPLSGVGENLQDHLQIPLTYKIDNAIQINEKFKIIQNIKNALFKNKKQEQHILGIFAKSNPARITPNLQINLQVKKQKITIDVANLRPESRGSVHINSPDGKIHPNITPNYLSTAADRQVAAESIRLIRKIFKATALEKFRPKEISPIQMP